MDPVLSMLQVFPGGSDGKEPARNLGDPGSIPGWGRSLGEGNDNPLQYSCLENAMDGGAWQATVHGVTKSRTQLRTSLPHYKVMSSLLTSKDIQGAFLCVYSCEDLLDFENEKSLVLYFLSG